MIGKVILVALAAGAISLSLALAWAWTPDRSLEELKTRWGADPSQFVMMDGMQVHFRDEGPRDDPTPIVLIHGTGSSLRSWDSWVDRLKTTRRVIRFDRPGFGLTGPNPSGDYSMDYYATFTGRFLNEREVNRAVIVGHSSGGYVAWRYAVEAPGRVAALVLLAPSGLPRSAPFPLGLRLARSRIMGPILEKVLPRSLAETSLRATYGDGTKVTAEAIDRSYELALRPGNRKALGETLRQMRDDPALIEQVQAPTLVFWGALDPVTPPVPDAERFIREVPDSKLLLLGDVGHVPHEEDPQGTLKAVQDFLAAQGLGQETQSPPAEQDP